MTKPDETRQKLHELTDRMQLAIGVLVGGGTTTDASDAAQVSRQTVSTWRNHHPAFCAALNARRRELLAERTDRIRDLDAKALAVVAAAIEDGNSDAALAWVKARHLHTVDVSEFGSSRAETLIGVKATEIRGRPEHAGSLASMMEGVDGQYALSRSEARSLAEKELAEILKDTNG